MIPGTLVSSTMDCLLCSAKTVALDTSFRKCSKCDLIFKNRCDFPDFEAEKARYETHNNDVQDPTYLKYLDRLFSLIQFQSGSVLDYGCGPSEGLAALVAQKGLEAIKVKSYDPIFFREADLSDKFDLIFASESFEHFYHPQAEIQNILGLLCTGGKLAVSTEFHDDHVIRGWWYARDPTHVVFYGAQTMIWLAQKFGLEILHLESPHVIFRKN